MARTVRHWLLAALTAWAATIGLAGCKSSRPPGEGTVRVRLATMSGGNPLPGSCLVYYLEIFAVVDDQLELSATTTLVPNQPDGSSVTTELGLRPGTYEIGGKALLWNDALTCPPPDPAAPPPDLESDACVGSRFVVPEPTHRDGYTVITEKPLVSLSCDFTGALDVGGGIVDATSNFPTSCASEIAMRGDEALAVCAQSSCHDGEAVFTFTNVCRTFGGDAPAYWVCGGPTMWTVYGELAKSSFPVPVREGSWRFGVLALDPRQLADPDPERTDEQGNLLVWRNMANPIAGLDRVGGINYPSLDAGRRAQLVAQLKVPPASAGQPSPDLVLIVRADPTGAQVQFHLKFGPCDVPASGNSAYVGLHAVKLRLLSASQVELRLSATEGGSATQRATCAAGRTSSGEPVLTCSPAEPLP